MKNIFYFLFSFIIALNACGQSSKEELIGIWQAGSDKESSAWLDNYQFFLDGKFIFNFNQYDGSKRIISIKGKYELHNDTLILIIEYSVEAMGGYIVRGSSAWEDEWVLQDAKIKEIKYDSPKKEITFIEKCNDHISTFPCIMIEKRKYYKMQSDPTKY